MFVVRGIWLLFIALMSAVLSAEENRAIDPKEILADFPNQLKLLSEFYTNYASDGQLVYETPDPTTKVYSPIRVIRGGLKVRENEMFRLSGIRYGVETLLIATPQRFHFFEKSPTTGRFFVRAHGGSYRPDGYPEEYFFRYGPCEPGCVTDALKVKPTYNSKIRRVSVTRENGEDMVVVETSAAEPGLPDRELITYYRDRYWAMKDYFSWSAWEDNKQYRWQRKHIDYEGESKGFPIMKQLIHETGSAPFGAAQVDHKQVYDPGIETGHLRYTLTVDHFTPGPPDLSVFDPAPILKEIGGLRQPTKPRWQVWFLALNAIFLIWLGLFCWRRSRKQDKPPPSSDTSSPTPAPP
jgi:hypothetical protein